jgi:hypothetical protein
MGLHKTKKSKSIFTAKEMVTKLRGQPAFVSYISDKGFITRIYRELKKLNSQRINDPMKKWENKLNRAFSKEAVQMAKKHMKKCSISLAIMLIKTRMAIIRTQTTTNVGKDAAGGQGREGTLIHCWWECK